MINNILIWIVDFYLKKNKNIFIILSAKQFIPRNFHDFFMFAIFFISMIFFFI